MKTVIIKVNEIIGCLQTKSNHHTFTINTNASQLAHVVRDLREKKPKVNLTAKKIKKHNRLTSGELLSNDRRAVGFVSS